MAVCLSNALRLKGEHALYTPLGVKVCAGLKEIPVRDDNYTIKRLGAGI